MMFSRCRFKSGLLVLGILGIFTACPSAPPPAKHPISDPLPVPDPQPDPVPDPDPLPPPEQTFTVTQEVYDRTFSEIEELIKTLNNLIANRMFDAWKSYLTPAAIASMSDTKTLEELSARPILQKFNIRLRNLQDYFTYVVVPSRSNAKLDEIVFMDNNHVTAYTVIKGEKTILYQLIKEGQTWKITIW